MLKKIFNKIFGDRKDRELKKLYPVVDEINEIYETLDKLSDDELRDRTIAIKDRIQKKLESFEKNIEELRKDYETELNEDKKERLGDHLDEKTEELKEVTQGVLDDELPETFAIVTDTCRRLKKAEYEYDVRGNTEKWFMIPFDEQLIGAVVLHQGKIAEMATGEGKTLVAVLPLFLNALTGRGTHLITVNDYLAQRDSEWMAPVFEFHGLEVGCITNEMLPAERKEMYKKDVTYGTNSEFGFDYLRDNMAVSAEQLVQQKLFYTIIDEVDSVLIDEARTPLIISGPVSDSKNFYKEVKPKVSQLVFKQNTMVKKIIREIKEMLQNDADPNEIGEKLLLVKRAAPKNKAFNNLMKESDLKKLVTDIEGMFIRDKKLHKIDEELYYTVDEKAKDVQLNDKGREELSKNDRKLFIMEKYDDIINKVDEMDLPEDQKNEKREELITNFIDKTEKIHNINQLLKSYALFEKDVDYVVMEDKVMIVDEFTGRMMPGRRFSDGLHQAIEAKEGVSIKGASQTLATITLQNYFRMYDKLAGMTGTAVTEESEFMEIYELSVIEVPTHLPITRKDYDDLIYMTKNQKYKAIMNEIEYWHKKNKPILVGTVSVDVSEKLSRMLRRRKIKHNVLNAKHHEKEAEIIKSAGEPGSVTIATNMAGRGTDIKLGKGVVEKEQEYYRKLDKKVDEDNPMGVPKDGLHVIGTERHESRRIDRQLRGRSGRQGDPGTSRFYLSLEDDLMRLFGSEKIAPTLMKFGINENEAITHPWMTRAVEKAQKKVESHNFEIRKQLLKYDEVMNQQREVIYTFRHNVLKGYDVSNEIEEMMMETLERVVQEKAVTDSFGDEWDLNLLLNWIRINLRLNLKESDLLSDKTTYEILYKNLEEIIFKHYKEREELMGSDQMRELERYILLSVVDEKWKDHLHEMDLLKEGVGLRAYGQKDPLIEYKKESFKLFENLITNIYEEVTKGVLTKFIVSRDAEIEKLKEKMKTQHAQASAFQPGTDNKSNKGEGKRRKIQPRRVEHKVGRNDPCPCGSGKKYKNCCGKKV